MATALHREIIMGRAGCVSCRRDVAAEILMAPTLEYRPYGPVVVPAYVVAPGQRCTRCRAPLDAAKVASLPPTDDDL